MAVNYRELEWEDVDWVHLTQWEAVMNTVLNLVCSSDVRLSVGRTYSTGWDVSIVYSTYPSCTHILLEGLEKISGQDSNLIPPNLLWYCYEKWLIWCTSLNVLFFSEDCSLCFLPLCRFRLYVCRTGTHLCLESIGQRRYGSSRVDSCSFGFAVPLGPARREEAHCTQVCLWFQLPHPFSFIGYVTAVVFVFCAVRWFEITVVELCLLLTSANGISLHLDMSAPRDRLQTWM
jgi:hypothetical protein